MKYVTTIVNAVRSYTNRTFIGGYYRGDIVITEDSISREVRPESIIEIRGSRHNDGFYWVKEDKTIDGLHPEAYTGYVIDIKLPIDKQLLIDMDNVLITSGKSKGVRRQQIHDVSYTLASSNSSNDLVGGVPKSMLSVLDHYRRLPCNLEEDYYRVGII